MKREFVHVSSSDRLRNDSQRRPHLRISENGEVEIVYFCDILPERARAAVEKYGCGMAVTDYHDVLRDLEVSAVSICTPNNVHAPINCLRAGKQVLCDKPAARTYAEGSKCSVCSIELF